MSKGSGVQKVRQVKKSETWPAKASTGQYQVNQNMERDFRRSIIWSIQKRWLNSWTERAWTKMIRTDPGSCIVPLDSFYQKPSRQTRKRIWMNPFRALLYYFRLPI